MKAIVKSRQGALGMYTVENASKTSLVIMLEPLGEYYEVGLGEEVKVQDNNRHNSALELGDDNYISLWTSMDAEVFKNREKIDQIQIS